MSIIDNATRKVFELPGIKHQTLASRADELEEVEIWMQTIEPGTATPIHYHECEEVIVILSGSGCLIVGERTQEFGPGATLVVRPKENHQLTNSGGGEMSLIAVLSETPGRVFSPDGSIMELPWS